MSAAAERRALTAYTLYEGLMRAVNAEDPAEAMDIEGSEALTPHLLLGGNEPSKEEEDLWFQERSRCAYLHMFSCAIIFCHASSVGFPCRFLLPRQSGAFCYTNWDALVAELFLSNLLQLESSLCLRLWNHLTERYGAIVSAFKWRAVCRKPLMFENWRF